MARLFWRGVRPAIFWSYARGSWQYDILVGLILAFIFLTPRAWFRDQPRIPTAQRIVVLPSDAGRSVFWIDPELLGDQEPSQMQARITKLLRGRTGKSVTLLGVEPVKDSEGNLKGYLVYARS